LYDRNEPADPAPTLSKEQAVTVLRYSPTGACLAFSTLLAGSALLMVSFAPAFAAPKPAAAQAATAAKAKVAVVEAAEVDAEGPAATGSTKAAAEEEGAGCQRARRKLWVDGEGWIVRRVTVC